MGESPVTLLLSDTSSSLCAAVKPLDCPLLSEEGLQPFLTESFFPWGESLGFSSQVQYFNQNEFCVPETKTVKCSVCIYCKHVVVIMVIAAGPLCLCPQCLEAAQHLSLSAEWHPAVQSSGQQIRHSSVGAGKTGPRTPPSPAPFIPTPL